MLPLQQVNREVDSPEGACFPFEWVFAKTEDNGILRNTSKGGIISLSFLTCVPNTYAEYDIEWTLEENMGTNLCALGLCKDFSYIWDQKLEP